MKEFLDIVNEKGMPTGQIVDRDTAHLKGIWHRTSHVWLVRKKNGIIQILLQKRSMIKSFPGCYSNVCQRKVKSCAKGRLMQNEWTALCYILLYYHSSSGKFNQHINIVLFVILVTNKMTNKVANIFKM